MRKGVWIEKCIEVRPAHLPARHLQGDEERGLCYCMGQMGFTSPAGQPVSGISTRKGYYKKAPRDLEIYSSMNRVIVRMLACFANVVEGPANMAVNTHRGTSSLVFPVHSRPPRLLNSGSHMLQRTCITRDSKDRVISPSLDSNSQRGHEGRTC